MMGPTPPPPDKKTPSESVADERPPATPRPSGRDDGKTSASATERQTLLRLASAGFELASFSLVLGGAGYGFDHWSGGTTPYFAIVGVLLGFSLGFYRLIVLASKMG